MPPSPRGIVYGFEKEDVDQEKALGALMAQRCQPGNQRAAESRAKVRAARHKKKERAWNSVRVTILDHDKTVTDEVRMAQLYLHEYLDFVPYMRREAFAIACEGDERKLGRIGRVIRDILIKKGKLSPSP